MSTTVIAAHKDPVIAIILDTIKQQRQTLVFCMSKRAAESQAEKTAKSVKQTYPHHKELAQQALNVLTHPTKQCKRLAACLEKGIAFHHAGLATKQRQLIETAFREGRLHAICSTPTLAAGLDLPAFRAIIRDVKRFGQRGMTNIPVLEYAQMAGRAGRPGKETHGEALLIAKDNSEAEFLQRTYIEGEVEDIFSKLAVEPVLRTYVLSLIATELITTTTQLYEFFDNTFYAHQYGDTTKLHHTLDRMIRILQEWEMLEGRAQETGFTTAANISVQEQELKATLLGQRVSELYLDPQTAHQFISGMQELETKDIDTALIHLLTCSLEIRPLIRARAKDAENIQAYLQEKPVGMDEYTFYTYSQDNFEDTIRTTQFFLAWIGESEEEDILEEFLVRPGEITAKTQQAIWLLHAMEELARLSKQHEYRKHCSKLQVRFKHGVKEELLPLLRFKGVGRVRARALFNANIKDTGDIVACDVQQLVSLIGPALTVKLKEQVGEKVDLETPTNTTTTQSYLNQF